MIAVAFLVGGVVGTSGALGTILFTDLGWGIALATYMALGYGVPLAALMATCIIKHGEHDIKDADVARH